MRERNFDSKMNLEILSELIIVVDLPFSIVELRMFRKYQIFFNEDCINISIKIVKYDVMEKYDIENKS